MKIMPVAHAMEKIILNARIIHDPDSSELRKLAKKDEITTGFGSAVYITKIRNRSAKFTEIIYNKPTREQRNILDRVVRYLRGKQLIQVDRTMCLDPKHKLACRSYVTRKYARVSYLWHEMLFPPESKIQKPKITLLFVPEWPERRILVDPKTYTTIALGSDYSGEMKKAGLRLAMYYAKKQGGLGLHAGCKDIFVRNKKGKLVEKGVLLFGLSATGKTTLTCHHHWVNEKIGERVIIRQDDVVFLWKDGSCTGTENNFYMKTENLDENSEPLLYKAVTSKNALIENVKIDKKGNMDFHNSELTSNGRAVVMRKELGHHWDEAIDLKKVNMIVFITRRNTIVPPMAKLTPEQAAAFFMLGESIETSAGDPTQAGKSIRVVGTNPFIIGPEYLEGNRFYEFIKKDKIDCYVLNTGHFGQNGNKTGVKITVHDSSALIIDAAKGDIEWKKDGFWGYLVPIKAKGIDLGRFDWKKYYDKKEYEKLNNELKVERKQWLAKFTKLDRKIKNAIK
ncbi:Phosphoenolpyruvate carboxykinase [Candidatus Bilamarchaeum dharawalense]|uniref:phosphoenolpyruvate carboxykinase (ATP) n=1 Tax=Candidatus Bilamarchaeum dharawalense TaxID=2885759 RepID=A0A5E4LNR5_9ARCH|nr:Phosphoenolpyruvate carboxykinase [Candidatus Bilamarchaeum dharawalense]